MRQIIAILIAMLALAAYTPALSAPAVSKFTNPAPLLDPAQTKLLLTPSLADFINDSWKPPKFSSPLITAESKNREGYIENTTLAIHDFLNDSWKPPKFSPPLITAESKSKKGYVENTTFAIYDFLNDSWAPPKIAAPVNIAAAATKDGFLRQSEFAIYQFLDDNWTPSTEIEAIGGGYSKYKMNR